jgi:hypothetical protein
MYRISQWKEDLMPGHSTEGVWRINRGTPAAGKRSEPWRENTEDLTYSNPFGQEIEQVWFEGRVVFATELGEVEVDLDRVKVAQEYQVVYDVQLGEDGKLTGEPQRVEGQFNIYDSVPGMEKYSPLWQFSYVVVPRDYEPNTLRSEADCLNSGYAIRRSTVVEN